MSEYVEMIKKELKKLSKHEELTNKKLLFHFKCYYLDAYSYIFALYIGKKKVIKDISDEYAIKKGLLKYEDEILEGIKESYIIIATNEMKSKLRVEKLRKHLKEINEVIKIYKEE